MGGIVLLVLARRQSGNFDLQCTKHHIDVVCYPVSNGTYSESGSEPACKQVVDRSPVQVKFLACSGAQHGPMPLVTDAFTVIGRPYVSAMVLRV